MMSIIIQITALLFLPGLILYLKRRSKVIRWVGPIVVCYLAGILAGNLSFLELNNELMSKTAEISVCLAIPILLFSCDVGKWLHHSKNTFISFSLAIIASSLFTFMSCESRGASFWYDLYICSTTA